MVRNRREPWHVYSHPTWHYADFYWDVENGRPHEIPGTGPDSVNAGERVVAGHNLHAYWDEILDRAIAPDPGEDSIAYATRMARRIERIHPRASLATPAASTDVVGWEREGLHLAQTVVYAGVTRGAPPSATYQAQALTVAERRIALAGYRLAALLNDALK